MSMNQEEDLKKKAETCIQQAYRFQMSGHIESAIKKYKESIDIFPTAVAHCFLGWAYSFSGNYKKAISECEKSIELDPDFGNPYNDIGAYLIQEGKLDEAITWLEKAMVASNYATPHFPHYNYGRILERRGLWFEALDEYKASLECDPNYTLAKDAFYRLQALLN